MARVPRIDTHHHVIPPVYRTALRNAGIDQAGGRALPDWSPEASLAAMADLDVATAILSVSAPGTTFLVGQMAEQIRRDHLAPRTEEGFLTLIRDLLGPAGQV